jgi:hypothetical protein
MQQIWSALIHLSFYMWLDWEPPEYRDGRVHHDVCRGSLRFDEPVWKKVTERMAEVGMNMLVLDLGDGVAYQSHPEIAVEGAWSVTKLKEQLRRLRELGLEPIPKMNFSTWHDVWLGAYHEMVSSDTYYRVCRYLIAEVCEIFEGPRLFHIGMDEEFATELEATEKLYKHQFTRAENVYWHDLYFLIGQVERAGSRPWAFFDERNPGGADGIYRKIPRSVVLTAWHYGRKSQFNRNEYKIKAFHELSDHGFDQIPCGSNVSCKENFGELVEYCRENTNPTNLQGFMTAPWQPTIEDCRDRIIDAIDQVGETI